MTSENEIKRFVEAPNNLIELCRDVINRLMTGIVDPETGEWEAQLLEISRAIGRLEKGGIPIPDALRSEKTRLSAALNTKTEAFHALNHLAEQFEDLLGSLNAPLGRGVSATEEKRPRRRRSNSPKTEHRVLREHIILALRKLGGRAHVSNVIEEIGHQLEGKWLPGDMEWRQATNEYAWQNTVRWERHKLIKDGLLGSDSPRGIWELIESPPEDQNP